MTQHFAAKCWLMQRFKLEILLFLTCFGAFAYFHQGGGWAQNVRFAMIRSIVEEGFLSIDSYLIYLSDTAAERQGNLVRVPVHDGQLKLRGKTCLLAWTDENVTQLIPIAGPYNKHQLIACLQGLAVSGDVAFHGGHFYASKAPGTALLGVPAYFLIYYAERLAGIDPDHWRTLTLNAWLTSALSVGLVCAIGCVIFFRLTLLLSGGRLLPSVLTAFGLAFGTMFFAYATMLQEHSLVATELLASWYLVQRTRSLATDGVGQPGRIPFLAFLSGACLGFACITNYPVGTIVLPFLAYLISRIRDGRACAWFAAGMIGPVLLISAYHWSCFGTPFVTNYSEVNPVFKTESGFMGMFTTPQWSVLPVILFSPFRGLFFSSPILLLGVLGLFHMLRTPRLKADGWLFICVILVFIAFNICFITWDGGWATGARYLSPALPFLTAPVVFGFIRFFKLACVLLTVSVAVNLLYTAVDPQSPLGVSPYASVADRQKWTYNQLSEYELPLFLTGRATPILDAKIDEAVSNIDQQLAEEHCPDDVRASRIAALRRKIQSDIEQGWSVSFGPLSGSSPYRTELALAGVTGPVSANPIGIYEGGYGFIFPLGTRQAQWNSFNLGEFIFPQSRLSLLPLLLVSGALAGWVLASAREKDRFFCSR